jgi:hypothetical protein
MPRLFEEATMPKLFRHLPGLVAALFAASASAEFHTFQIEQVFSNEDGTVQFVIMHESQGMNGEGAWAGQALTATHNGMMKTFAFTGDLTGGNIYTGTSSPTAGKRVLIATQGFAALNIVPPDFIMPNGFIATDGVLLNYAGVDFVALQSLPTDGVNALNRSGAVVPNVATNFIGQSGSVSASTVSYQGLWYNSPAESEAGWGINFAHQGDVIFATWFTYDASGKAWWLSMTANKTAEGVYGGQLIRTNATPFSAYAPPATVTVAGGAIVSFTSPTTGMFSYTLSDGANAATQTKNIVLQAFGPVPTCVWGGQPDLTLATNYQDLWWAVGGAESGWGVNLTQQGTTIFATWFTYDANHNPLWLSATASLTAPKTYSGTLLLTGGPAFSAVPFDPSKVTRKPVGTATFTFTDGNTGTFSYSVDLGDGVNKATQTKAITRQVFRAPGTTCQ